MKTASKSGNGIKFFSRSERLWHFRGSSSLLETGGDFVMAEVLSYRLSAGNTRKIARANS